MKRQINNTQRDINLYAIISSSYHESIKAIDPYIINYKLSKYRIYSEKSKIYSVF